MRLLIAIFLTFLTATVSASTRFTCTSIEPNDDYLVQGEFKEIPNRHGEGNIQFMVIRPRTNLTQSGKAHTIAVDEIEYSDNEIQLVLRDSNYSKGNVSTLVINNQQHTMICSFTFPSIPTCSSWCCHHTCH